MMNLINEIRVCLSVKGSNNMSLFTILKIISLLVSFNNHITLSLHVPDRNDQIMLVSMHQPFTIQAYGKKSFWTQVHHMMFFNNNGNGEISVNLK